MNKLRVAVIGLGVMGECYARLCLQNRLVELVAVCGWRAERVEPISRALGVPGYADGDHQRMFSEHGAIDAVIVATPDDAHLASAKAALAAGAHVLVEKPLGIDATEAKEIVDQAAVAGKMLMVCHHLRFDPRYHRLAQAVRAGSLGKVINVYARRNPAATSAERIGGRVHAAYWVGVHDIDLVHWITGQRAVKVFAKATGSSLDHLGVDDCVVSTITLADGALFLLENSWATPQTQGNPRSFLMTIRGSRGIGEVEAYEHGLSIYTPEATANLGGDVLYFPAVHGRAIGVYRDMVDHFLDCVATGREPAVQGEDGWAAVVVADAIMRSLRSEREVSIEWP